MPTNPSTTLETIQAKVRLLTRTPSTAQLPDATLNQYINTFVAYDMPDHVKLFDTKTTFSFYCQPFVDVYYTDTVNVAATDVLYDFQNKYTSIDSPLLIAGYESYLSQSREEFFQQYPLANTINKVGTGNGTKTVFTGTLNATPILRNEVTFTSVDINGAGLTLIDNGAGSDYTNLGTTDAVTGNFSVTVPGSTFEIGQQFYIGTTVFTCTALGAPAALSTTSTVATGTYNTTTGDLVITGNTENPTTAVYFSPVTLTDPVLGTSVGTINYNTGYFNLIFATAPANGQAINAQTVVYSAGRPTTMLFYDNKFTLRPVPDQPYKITFDVFMRPVALAAMGNPQLQDWWQYIAYGAAKKILEDRMDMDSVGAIMPEFKQQERLVLRKTIVNQTKERTPTIYSQQTGLGTNPFGWNRNF
ncbi:MAG TPA: hypothetical protein VMV86_03510 [Methanosarcinales archaeon]|nr:hypothetical protein [Methanosarcinales archaeon]